MPYTKTLEEGLKEQQEDSELSVFWEEFSKHLPKSVERSALGDEKIFRAFKATYPKIRAYLAEKIRVSLVGEITGETSDGYHTFDELYEFRKLYNANLFNEWYSQNKYNVHKSLKHNDGELCFGGWFIVMATTPEGQISNHYEIKDWDLFNCEDRMVADKWDGHTPKDVVNTLLKLAKLKHK